MERDAQRQPRREKVAGFDPFEALRSLVQRAERDLNRALTELSRGGAFGTAAGAWQRAELGARRAARGAFGWWFASLNLPTRSDVIRLGRRLAEIEKQLARLESSLDAASADRTPPFATRRPARLQRDGSVGDTAGRPRRTRKPPLGAAKPAPAPRAAP